MEIYMKKIIKAVMLGHAVGDALGVPVEFVRRETLDGDPVVDMRGYGTYHVPKGSWSDDTGMAIATLDSISSGRVDYEKIMERFVAWAEDGEYTPEGKTFDIGTTTLRAIRNFLSPDCRSALECGPCEDHANGNGSLMRIHPIALYLALLGVDEEEALDTVSCISSLTHGHERSRLGCMIYYFVLREILLSPDKTGVVRGLSAARERLSESYECHTYFDRVLGRMTDADEGKEEAVASLVKREEIKSTGYVVDTLEAAIWCALTTNSYKECVLKAVNLGDDTDTVAAIAGGLAGAMYGLESIPEEYSHALLRREYIEKLCEKAAKGWSRLVCKDKE